MENYDINNLKIYEDDDYIAFDKPSGLRSVPDRFNSEIPCLSRMAEDVFGNIFTVHRLDKDTSGVIVYAKNTDSHRYLNIAFDKGKVKKQYIALIDGIPEERNSRIELRIGENSKKKGTMIIDEQTGKESITDYKITEFFSNKCLVLVTPRTGRTHQIRVHFSAIGHPVMNDPLYGIKQGGRLMLHAYTIQFITRSKKEVRITAEPGNDFKNICEEFRRV